MALAFKTLFLAVLVWVAGCAEIGRNVRTPAVPAGAIVIRGALVSIAVPPELDWCGAHLIVQADLAVRIFGAVLGLPEPPAPLGPLVVRAVLSAEEAKPSSRAADFGIMGTVIGKGAVVDMLPTGQRTACSGAGDLEAVMLHELAHLYQRSLVRNFHEQPAWLREGTAEWLAYPAMSETSGATLKRQLWFSERVRSVLAATGTRTMIPLARLLDHAFARDAADRSLAYAEAFSLALFLDDPDHPERRAAWRSFLRAAQQEQGSLLRWRLNRRLLGAFPGEAFAFLEKEWLAWIKRQVLSDWLRVGLEVNVDSNGGVLLQSYGALGYATSRALILDATHTRVDATVQQQTAQSRSFAFVVTAPGKEVVMVKFDRAGSTALTMISSARPDGEEFVSPTRSTLSDYLRPHHVSIEFAGGRIDVSVDEEQVLSRPLALLPAGPVMVIVFDGSISFPRLETLGPAKLMNP